MEQKVVGNLYTSAGPAALLTTLCDDFRSRFGGTEGAALASDLLKERFTAYGLHSETVTMAGRSGRAVAERRRQIRTTPIAGSSLWKVWQGESTSILWCCNVLVGSDFSSPHRNQLKAEVVDTHWLFTTKPLQILNWKLAIYSRVLWWWEEVGPFLTFDAL